MKNAYNNARKEEFQLIAVVKNLLCNLLFVFFDAEISTFSSRSKSNAIDNKSFLKKNYYYYYYYDYSYSSKRLCYSGVLNSV
jgi:hypothetical protein